jgi:hypothetical protein
VFRTVFSTSAIGKGSIFKGNVSECGGLVHYDSAHFILCRTQHLRVHIDFSRTQIFSERFQRGTIFSAKRPCMKKLTNIIFVDYCINPFHAGFNANKPCYIFSVSCNYRVEEARKFNENC